MPPPRARRRAPRPIGLLALLLFLYAAVAASLVPQAAPAAPKKAGPGFRLLDRLAEAKVSLRTGGAERPCPWHAADRRFVCSPDAWGFVGAYAGYADGKALRCVWMHPHGGGATTVLRWPEVRFGERLLGSVTLLEDVGPGADVVVRLFAGETRLAEARTSESRSVGTFDVPISPGPSEGTLRLELSASDHAWRLACVDFRMTGRRLHVAPATPTPARKPALPHRKP